VFVTYGQNGFIKSTPARVPQADRVAQIHGQTDRVPGRDAAARRAAGGAPAHDQLLEERPEQGPILLNSISAENFSD
jgi:hypothetical protein